MASTHFPNEYEHAGAKKRLSPESSAQAQLQEAEYVFPYHYIPQLGLSQFSQTRHYSWGFRYMGGLEVVSAAVARYQPATLIDIGCGDGRFLAEASKGFPETRMLGVDYSAAAIAYAKAFNPSLRFEARDIITNPFDERFAVATLVEVLEHIEPNLVPDFLAAIRHHLTPGGRLILTVPHKNSPLIPKHFQHFDAEQLRAILSEHFHVERISYFDSRRDFSIRVAKFLLGGAGRQFVVTNRRLNHLFMKRYLQRFLYVEQERDCRRLLAVAQA
ncbi:MAG: class I SAM-dependent methyltransferase [Gammaproteobacteria bacterium]|nr:class I SAM-dependent methyltransferase [Gammaproteobacteria bacterium]